MFDDNCLFSIGCIRGIEYIDLKVTNVIWRSVVLLRYTDVFNGASRHGFVDSACLVIVLRLYFNWFGHL